MQRLGWTVRWSSMQRNARLEVMLHRYLHALTSPRVVATGRKPYIRLLPEIFFAVSAELDSPMSVL